MRFMLIFAALIAALGGVLAAAEASQDRTPDLVPIARADSYNHAERLAFSIAPSDSRSLQYGPSRREHEDDEDERDEPHR